MELLTRSKAERVARNRPGVIAGKPLNNPSVLEAKFSQQIDDRVRKMCDTVKAELVRFFEHPDAEEYFADSAMDASISPQARMLTAYSPISRCVPPRPR